MDSKRSVTSCWKMNSFDKTLTHGIANLSSRLSFASGPILRVKKTTAQSSYCLFCRFFATAFSSSVIPSMAESISAAAAAAAAAAWPASTLSVIDGSVTLLTRFSSIVATDSHGGWSDYNIWIENARADLTNLYSLSPTARRVSGALSCKWIDQQWRSVWYRCYWGFQLHMRRVI